MTSAPQSGRREKPPAFQFYAKDFLAGTLEMTLEQLGAYIKFLAWSWDSGPLSLDEQKRAAVVGLKVKEFRRVWSAIEEKWVQIDTGYVNLRLEQQRADLEAFIAEQSVKGKAGAAKRWQRHSRGHSSGHSRSNGRGIAQAIAEGMPGDSSAVCSLQLEDQERVVDTTLDTPESLRSAWNELTQKPIHRCLELNRDRVKHANARLKERRLEDWRVVIARIQASAFCRGETDRSDWKATFDWLLQPGTAVKVLEGQYDDKAPSQASRPAERSFRDQGLLQ